MFERRRVHLQYGQAAHDIILFRILPKYRLQMEFFCFRADKNILVITVLNNLRESGILGGDSLRGNI